MLITTTNGAFECTAFKADCSMDESRCHVTFFLNQHIVATVKCEDKNEVNDVIDSLTRTLSREYKSAHLEMDCEIMTYRWRHHPDFVPLTLIQSVNE